MTFNSPRCLAAAVWLLAAVPLVASAQTARITGRVLGADSTPASGATVVLSGTRRVTAADASGAFTLDSIVPGTYVLVASLSGKEPGRIQVQARAGETAHVVVRLGTAVRLAPVVVTGSGDRSVSSNSSTVATRTDTPPLETPQSFQAVTSRVIEDQQLETINEATRYLTGVIAATNYSQYTLRGFDVYDDAIMTNGFRGNLYQYPQQAQLSNIERVEVLKGPASALYSAGSPGGVLNMVTKQPQVLPMQSLTLGAGAWGLYEGDVDLTGPVSQSGAVLYRFIGSYRTLTDSYRDFQYQKNLLLAPSIAWVLPHEGRLTFEADLAWQNARFAYDRGSYIRENPDSTFDFAAVPIGYSHQSPYDYSSLFNASGSLTYDQMLSPRLRVTALLRYIYQSIDMGEHNGDFSTDPMNLDSLPRQFDTWVNEWFTLQTSAYATYTTQTGDVHHTFLFGIDATRAGSLINRYELGQAQTFLNVAQPDYSNDAFGNFPANLWIEHDVQRNRRLGGYVQDQIGWGNWRFLAALRYDTYRSTVAPTDSLDYSQVTDTSSAQAFVPRFGMVYLVNPDLAVYGSYNTSFLPQYSNSRGSGGPFPPQTGRQVEIGTKAQLATGLSATLAFYGIEYNDILAQDPTDSTGLRQIPVPGVQSRGAELTVQGNLPRLAIVAGYGYNRTTLTQNSSFGNKGDTYANAPENIANVWAAYDVVAQSRLLVTLGAGARYVSTRIGDITDQRWFILPAYTMVDASAVIRYQKYRLVLAGSNLLDEKWFPGGYYSRTLILVGDPLNVRMSLSYDF